MHICYFFHLSLSLIFIYVFLVGQVLVAACGIFRCGVQALHCSVRASLQQWHRQAQQLRHMGFIVLRHVGSQFLTRNQTQVPCIGRWILNHWTTREVLLPLFEVPCFYRFLNLVLQVVDVVFNCVHYVVSLLNFLLVIISLLFVLCFIAGSL